MKTLAGHHMRIPHLLVRATLVALFCVAGLSAQGRGGASVHGSIEIDLNVMNARLGSGGRSSHDVVTDAQRLTEAYRSLGLGFASFGLGDQARNRETATQAFAWLSRARVLYPTDAAVTAQLMQAYAAMGAFYRDYGTFYPEGARTAFGGASELARMMVLREASGQPYEQELSRYVLAYAAAAAAYGGGFSASAAPSAPAASTQPAGPPVSVLKPLELPTVDATGLSADQRAQWMELRDQFRSTSARVHEARIRMNDLAARLEQRGMTVNVTAAATAATMQGFLEDAVELAGAREFVMASQAVVRAEYLRAKLKSVIGE